MTAKANRADEKGSAVIIALLVMILLTVLGMGLLAMSETETLIAANDQWSEGAFQAAEAAVQEALDRLEVGTTNQVVPETEIGGVFAFRSGGRADAGPQAPQLVGTAPGVGYAEGSGTGYNASGYVFAIYSVRGTGTGPRSTEREVEVQVEIGPISQ